MLPRTYVLAVDIGQSNDYTAAVVLDSYTVNTSESPWPSDRQLERRHDLVHAERFRDLSYPAQIERIRERYDELKRIANEQRDAVVRVVVDATGVGKPILDALREGGIQHALGVIITGGDATSSGDGVTRVPKRVLASSLQVALQAKRLQIAPELRLAETLLSEFRAFKVKISLAGHARFGNDVGAWREAEHDDLVLATALGVWLLEGKKRTALREARRAAGVA